MSRRGPAKSAKLGMQNNHALRKPRGGEGGRERGRERRRERGRGGGWKGGRDPHSIQGKEGQDWEMWLTLRALHDGHLVRFLQSGKIAFANANAQNDQLATATQVTNITR